MCCFNKISSLFLIKNILVLKYLKYIYENSIQFNLGSEGPRGLTGIQGERGIPGNIKISTNNNNYYFL